ncbi:GntR family transcriptional regulator [Pseudomonas sp. PD9R]|uniref:GntR family transcriptional regulator n=1 Tax=Pseudomonas sp. PD9R TaxID=2853534 RepID=UPI001C497925|nr:GntR family transcriptional regulator [Pseudomonas sp. PD9R]MBV6824188.1 GntR family transcriptional regulator [Pseudomonas sp. PD9R]
MNSFATAQYTRELPTALPFCGGHRAKPLVDDLYPRVFDAILEQRITPTSRFTEESLAQMFDASRSQMRRVLTRLSHEQVIILRPNHRPRVATPAPEQTRQILHARRLTETKLIQLACQQPRRGGLYALRELIEKHRQYLECDQRGSAIRVSGEFHLQLAHLSANTPLAHFLHSLVPLTSLAIAQHKEKADGYCSWSKHLAVVDALEQTDASSAVLLMTQHLDDLEQRLIRTTP